MALKVSRWRTALLTIAAFAAVLTVISVAVAPTVKARLVRGANERLVGYSLQIGSMSIYPWNLELVARDLTVRQLAHPTPEVLFIQRLDVELQWLSLLRGRLVAVSHLDSARVNINIAQLNAEANGPIAFRERGWQRLLELYPLEVNDLQVRHATLTYTAEDATRPLQFREGWLDIRNIRRVQNKDQRYPSPVHATAVVFDSGKAVFDGAADFVRFSRPAVKGTMEVDTVPLDTLGPILKGYPLKISGGIVDALGEIESTPAGTAARLARVHVKDIQVDYLGGSDPAVQEAARRAVKAAQRAARDPGLQLALDDLQVDGEFGYVNQKRNHTYRLYLGDSKLSMRNAANHDTHVESTVALTGLLMGNGRTSIYGAFRSGTGAPDFALDVRVVDTDLTSLNDALLAHTRLDVAKGSLSVYSQVLVRNGRISGYVKPLLRDVKVYGPQDADKNTFHQFYERLADAVRQVLQNHQRHEVATVTNLSGTIADPNTSTLQIIGNLMRNAFFDAIVPGFDRRASGTPRKAPIA